MFVCLFSIFWRETCLTFVRGRGKQERESDAGREERESERDFFDRGCLVSIRKIINNHYFDQKDEGNRQTVRGQAK